MGIRRKAIDSKMAEKAIECLREEPTTSLVGFIEEYFDVLSNPRRNLKEKYDVLLEHGLDVGTYQSFKSTYYQVKKRLQTSDRGKQKPNREERNITQERPQPALPVATPEREVVCVPEAEEKAVNTAFASKGLRPILLPDGTPVEVTETGAKKFKI